MVGIALNFAVNLSVAVQDFGAVSGR